MALVLGGIAAVLTAGVALGFASQPREVGAASAEAAATPLNVELAPPAPLPPEPAAEPLDVRPTGPVAPAPARPRRSPDLSHAEPAEPVASPRPERIESQPEPEEALDAEPSPLEDEELLPPAPFDEPGGNDGGWPSL